ncbi:hypothetical protein GCM10023321_84690 [Pseudonocardia eucalypti]|uniref:Uncharacterized protein n=1 Tax=Pseudonocardia eucalypti TaxID=648755 RepID=A0ABP9RFR9_9PSEU
MILEIDSFGRGGGQIYRRIGRRGAGWSDPSSTDEASGAGVIAVVAVARWPLGVIVISGGSASIFEAEPPETAIKATRA